MTNNNTGQRRQISSREKRLQERKKARNASTARNDNNMEAADEEVLFTPVGTIPTEGEEISDGFLTTRRSEEDLTVNPLQL